MANDSAAKLEHSSSSSSSNLAASLHDGLLSFMSPPASAPVTETVANRQTTNRTSGGGEMRHHAWEALRQHCVLARRLARTG